MADDTKVRIVAEDAASAVFSKLEGQVGNLTEKFGPLGGTVESVIGKIGPAGIAFAGVAGAAIGAYEGIKLLAEKAIDAGDKISDLSKQTGVAGSTISQYKAFLENSGSSAEGFATAVGKMNVKLGEARAGNKDAIASFKDLGLSMDDIKSMSPEQALLKIADAVKNTSDPTAVAAGLNAVFGKSWRELVPALSEGSDGFKAAAAQAQALGLAMSDEFVSRADQTQDALDNVGRITTGLSNKVAEQLMPTIKASADGLLEWAAKSGAIDVAANVIAGAFNLIVNIGQVVGAYVKVVINQISGLFEAVVLFIKGEYTQAWDKAVGTYKSSGQIITDTASNMAKVWTGELGKFEPASTKAANSIGQITVKSKETKPEVDKAAQAFSNFAKSLSEKLAVGEAELAQGSKLTEGQKLLLKFTQDLENGTLKATESEKAATLAKIERILQIEREEAASKALEQANKDMEKARLAEREAIAKQFSEVDGLIKKQQEENEKIGLTKAEQAELTAKRYDDIKAQYDAKIASIATVEALQDQAAELAILSTRYGDLAREVREGAIKTANQEAAEKAQKAWKETSESIEKSLTDALLRGFESGKGVVQNLVSTIKNLFNTLVLRPIIQAAVQPITGAITSTLGFTNVASAATGGSNALSLAGGAGSLATMFGNFSGGVTGGLQALFGANSIGGTLDAAFTAFGAGNVAGGLGTLAGVAGPVALGVFALSQLLKSKGGPKTGGSFDSSGSIGRLFTPDNADTTAQTLGTGILESITNTVKDLGGTSAGLQLGFGFDQDPKGDSASRVASILRTSSGKSLYSNLGGIDVGRDEATFQSGVSSEAARLILAGIKASTLPENIAEVFSKLDVGSVTADQLAGAIKDAKALLPKADDAASALDAALNDSGTQVAVSTEVATLIEVQRDALGVAKEQRDILQAQVTQVGSMATELATRLDALKAVMDAIAGNGALAAAATA